MNQSMKRLLLVIHLVITLVTMAMTSPVQAARLALVIGNAAYTEGPLKNPVNDARAMDQKLTTLGFRVQRVENLKRTQIGRAISAFANTVRAGDDVVVFYAGHGVQVKGINYLPAVDADIQSEEDVALNSLNLNSLMERLDEAKAGLKIMFLDACRNNPYARSFRSGDRGLARVSAAPSGTLIHFATRPGSVAADGSGLNGLYTSELLRHMDSPNVPIEAMLKRVSAAVELASKGTQEPWTEGSIRGEFYFRDTGAIADTQVASMRAERTGRPNRSDPEEDAWQATKGANTVGGYEAYLREYPKGRYAGAARVAKAALQVLPVLQPHATIVGNVALAGPVFQDCADCPEMVVIPAGSFLMGSNDSSSEQPIHNVDIQSFALGKFEISQGQWKAVMGTSPIGFSSCGDSCSVANVSWNDIQEYIQKLNQKSGHQYRLPSEAEWEYAARAGTSSKYWWGDTASHEYANYGKDQCCAGLAQGRDAWENTAPAGQFPPNAFGLHDMHGNVFEWVQDWYHNTYSTAPSDGSVWVSGGDQKERVLRGGSWYGNPFYLRSAYRYGSVPGNRFYGNGFRLARNVLKGA
jgi:formylglycine-generating enzyme required for sulfatase activity